MVCLVTSIIKSSSWLYLSHLPTTHILKQLQPNRKNHQLRSKKVYILKPLTLTFERRTGDSRNEVGLSPGEIMVQADLEIGSLAGDISLYLAPPPQVSGLVGSPPSGTSERELMLSMGREGSNKERGEGWFGNLKRVFVCFLVRREVCSCELR
jgi:hypothetical protein